MEETNEGQIDLSRVLGYFDSLFEEGEWGHRGGGKAWPYVEAMVHEIRAARHLIKRLEAAARAPQPDLAGYARQEERARCIALIDLRLLPLGCALGEHPEAIREALRTLREEVEDGAHPKVNARAGGAS